MDFNWGAAITVLIYGSAIALTIVLFIFVDRRVYLWGKALWSDDEDAQRGLRFAIALLVILFASAVWTGVLT